MPQGEIARICNSCTSHYPNPAENCIVCSKGLSGGGEIARICNSCTSHYPNPAENCIVCSKRL